MHEASLIALDRTVICTGFFLNCCIGGVRIHCILRGQRALLHGSSTEVLDPKQQSLPVLTRQRQRTKIESPEHSSWGKLDEDVDDNDNETEELDT